MGLDDDLWVLGGLVGGGDAGEVLDLAGAGLLVEALGVALLGDLDGDVDVDLDEGEGLVLAGAADGVEVAGDLAVGAVGGDEGGEGDGGAVGKELGDLGDAAYVLVAVGLGEAEVLVEAEADVVAVEAVGGEPEVQEVLLEGGGDGGLARGAEAREPDGEALLLARGLALGAGEGGVPGDVAVLASFFFLISLVYEEGGLVGKAVRLGLLLKWWGEIAVVILESRGWVEECCEGHYREREKLHAGGGGCGGRDVVMAG